LGKLEYSRRRDAWVGVIDVPAFRRFTHTWDDHVPGRCDLIINAEDEADTPSARAVELALRLLENQERLARQIVTALWDDFNGRGPRSGMWWHGDLEQVVESGEGEDVPPLESADALFGWMHPGGIVVRHGGVRDDEPPVIELTCSAVFEVEHGVGILTDGDAILGTGYLYDVEPFESP
jgi:hypothetical protein